MTWYPVAPDGTQSVKANKTRLLSNTQYTQLYMGDTANDTTNTDSIRDHYWHVDSTYAGRHRFINSPAFTIAGTPDDPVLGNGMGGTSYFKEKTAAEAPTNQDVQAFFRNSHANVMQIPSVRACILVDLTPNIVSDQAAPTAVVKYAHNCTADFTDFTFAANRKLVLSFTDQLPTVEYFVETKCVNANLGLLTLIQELMMFGTALSDVKTKDDLTLFLWPIAEAAGTTPIQIMVTVWGG